MTTGRINQVTRVLNSLWREGRPALLRAAHRPSSLQTSQVVQTPTFHVQRRCGRQTSDDFARPATLIRVLKRRGVRALGERSPSRHNNFVFDSLTALGVNARGARPAVPLQRSGGGGPPPSAPGQVAASSPPEARNRESASALPGVRGEDWPNRPMTSDRRSTWRHFQVN